MSKDISTSFSKHIAALTLTLTLGAKHATFEKDSVLVGWTKGVQLIKHKKILISHTKILTTGQGVSK